MPSSPRKKTSKKSSTKKSEGCRVCGKPVAVPEGEVCVAHEIIDMVTGYTSERADAAGGPFAGLWTLGGQIVSSAIEKEMHKKAVFAARMKYAQHQAQKQRAQQQQQQQQQQQARPQRDPFAVLGLDRSATEQDVRSRQRELARIFHTDAGGGAAANERMAEVNAAADEAIRILKG